MAIDVESHELVPEHEVMDEDAVETLLDEYDIERDQLPKIDRNDAAVKPLDAEVGDVIKITRDSPTAGTTTYYRLVTEV